MDGQTIYIGNSRIRKYLNGLMNWSKIAFVPLSKVSANLNPWKGIYPVAGAGVSQMNTAWYMSLGATNFISFNVGFIIKEIV